MNFENIGSGGLGGLIGGILALIGFNRRLSRLETKLDEVVSHEVCETIRRQTEGHIEDMKEDMRYIRNRLDTLLDNTKRHREDFDLK